MIEIYLYFNLKRRQDWRHRDCWRVQTVEQDCSLQCPENIERLKQQEAILEILNKRNFFHKFFFSPKKN